MLYGRWREVVRQFPNEIALRDLSAGQAWSFSEIALEVERAERADSPLCFPQGNGAGFVFEVLRAWRDSRIVFPLEDGQARPSSLALPPAEIVHLKSTSATTGVSRLIAFRGEQLAADAGNIVSTMGLRPDWPNLGVISLGHSYGFSNLVLPLLLHGIPLLLAGSVLPEAIRTAARLVPRITLAAVPALWRTWRDALCIPGNTQLAISAGAPLPLSLEREVHAVWNLKIHNFYGSSECGGIAYDAAEKPRTKPEYVGTALRNVKVTIAGNGCLQVQSSAVAETYWPEPSENLAEGVFRTGDLGEVQNERIILRGRSTDQINVAGRKLSPELVEHALLLHPQVRQCVVFAVPSTEAHRGETVVAAVVTTTSAEALKRHASEQLLPWQVPRRWWLLDTLEFNRRGKISRAELKTRFLRDQGRPGA